MNQSLNDKLDNLIERLIDLIEFKIRDLTEEHGESTGYYFEIQGVKTVIKEELLSILEKKNDGQQNNK